MSETIFILRSELEQYPNSESVQFSAKNGCFHSHEEQLIHESYNM